MLLEKLSTISKKTWICISVITTVVVVIASVSTVLVVRHRRKLAQKVNVKKVVVTQSKPITTTEPTTTQPVEIIKVKLNCSSVQNDLKIKVLKEKDNKYLTGVSFKVIVKDKQGNSTEYVDKNQNGKIYVSKVKAGRYSIELKPIEGVEVTVGDAKVLVKDKVEYKVITDIKEKVKKDDPKEDTKQPQQITQEITLNDTVKFVDSSSRLVKPESVDYISLNFSNIQSPTDSTTTSTTAGSSTSTTASSPTSTTAGISINTSAGISINTSAGISINTSAGIDTTGTTQAQRLVDNNGDTVYIKVGEQYRVAMSTDYVNTNEFYLKQVTPAEYRYTGWQQLDGRTYYYDENNNYVVGEQVINGAKYTFNPDGSLRPGSGILGIDVSKWQGRIDWRKVKASGVKFAIIRAGYRGWGTGKLVEDTRFKQNVRGALANGIDVGVYFFSQAVNEVEAVEEASLCVELVKNTRIKYPIYIDTETSGGNGAGRADGLTVAQRTAVCKAFCSTIQSRGYRAGIYTSKSWFVGKLNTPQLSRYNIWLAQWTDKPTYKNRYDVWQYTSKGTVNGINGRVDMNLCYMTF